MKTNSIMIGSEMTSLNKPLFEDFSIEELEARLETDPLMFTQVFGNAVIGHSDDSMPLSCDCRKLSDCPNLTCLVDSCPEFK